MSDGMIKKGFWLAGIANIGGVLLFSRFFSNEALNQADPVVMSNFGLVGICLWGLAYIAAARGYRGVRPLSLVFAVEKLVYITVWLFWMKSNFAGLGALLEKDFLAGAFFCVYGVNDITFMFFFAYAYGKSKPVSD